MRIAYFFKISVRLVVIVISLMKNKIVLSIRITPYTLHEAICLRNLENSAQTTKDKRSDFTYLKRTF